MGDENHPLTRESSGPGPALRAGFGVCRSLGRELRGRGDAAGGLRFPRRLRILPRATKGESLGWHGIVFAHSSMRQPQKLDNVDDRGLQSSCPILWPLAVSFAGISAAGFVATIASASAIDVDLTCSNVDVWGKPRCVCRHEPVWFSRLPSPRWPLSLSRLPRRSALSRRHTVAHTVVELRPPACYGPAGMSNLHSLCGHV